MNADGLFGRCVLGHEVLVVALGLQAIFEQYGCNLKWLIVPEAVGFHVHRVKIRLEEPFSLEPHSISHCGLIHALLALKCIHVEA